MNKGNKCLIDSSSSNEKEFRHNQYPYHQRNLPNTSQNGAENPLSHICKYLDVPETEKSSKENVELALEVEIDESLKRLLTTAERNSSDLLDVTIIRPSDSDTTHETTVALYKDEVKEFITLVEQHQKHQLNHTNPQENQSDKFGENGNNNEDNTKKETPKHPQDDPKNDRKLKKELGFSPAYKNNKSQIGKNSNINEKHVYATVNTFDKLKQSLPCQNMTNRNNEKPGTPCMCQHCGVVGVLVQSQKGPVAPFPPIQETNETPRNDTTQRTRNSSPSRRDQQQRKSTIDVKPKKSMDQLQLLREINLRIRNLEKRIAVQEETAVPREYLKHILHKVLTHYSIRAGATSSVNANKLKNNSTQYSAKNIVDPKSQSAGTQDRSTGKETRNKCYQVHTVLEDQKNWIDYSNNEKNEKTENQKQGKDLYWFWGEEVVRPGCDLKNKILKLFDDKFNRTTYRAKQTDCSTTKPDVKRHYFISAENDMKGGENKDEGIKIVKDEKTIFLKNVEEIQSSRNTSYLFHSKHQEAVNMNKNAETVCEKLIPNPETPRNNNKFSSFRHIFPKTNYPFDLKKTVDDSTFKRNIEAQKEKFKEKVAPPVVEKYYNAYACQSMTTESQASMEYLIQKLRNNGQIIESGLTREKEAQIEGRYKIPPAKDVPGSLIKQNIHMFRRKAGDSDEGSVDVKYMNPRIRVWSEESTTSESKIMRQTTKYCPEKKEPVTLEKKESLIYKLDFLKNLAKNKSTDQSRVLNKIWNQAKNTAKSKKDAVYIKIPFKNVNACETQENLIEMHLTLEELETVVKSAKVAPTSKSSSDIDLGQRRHEEIKSANRETLGRRQMSARNKYKEKR